jgi:sugar-specific transcriptional regulator TrmB
MNEESLVEIGLSRNEAKVYLALLRLSSASAGEITGESGVHRRNVYDSIERLVKHGLVGHIVKGKIKYFEAANPSSLLNIIEEEKSVLEDKAKSINAILPELLLVHGRKEKESVIIYKGVKGIKTVLEDILKTGETNRVLGAHRPPKQIKNYMSVFHARRVRSRIKDKLIFEKGDAERARSLAKLPFTEIRLLPTRNGSNTAVNIYGDRVAILMWSEPVAIVIKNREVADSFRLYFDLIWETLKA